jgi:hypothetical protein
VEEAYKGMEIIRYDWMNFIYIVRKRERERERERVIS